MTRRATGWKLAPACWLLGAAVVAGAGENALSTLLEQEAGTPLLIDADKVSGDLNDRTLNYRGNIQMSYGRLRVAADSIDYEQQPQGLLRAEGAPLRAVIERGQQLGEIEIAAQGMTMQRPYRQVEFRGDVAIFDGKNRLSSDAILYDLDDDGYSGENIKMLITDLQPPPGESEAQPGDD